MALFRNTTWWGEGGGGVHPQSRGAWRLSRASLQTWLFNFTNKGGRGVWGWRWSKAHVYGRPYELFHHPKPFLPATKQPSSSEASQHFSFHSYAPPPPPTHITDSYDDSEYLLPRLISTPSLHEHIAAPFNCVSQIAREKEKGDFPFPPSLPPPRKIISLSSWPLYCVGVDSLIVFGGGGTWRRKMASVCEKIKQPYCYFFLKRTRGGGGYLN